MTTHTPDCIPRLIRILWSGHQDSDPKEPGYVKSPIPYDHEGDAYALRRISMTLHRWHELECGSDAGAIERDEQSGKPYWYNPNRPHASRIPCADREGGALKALKKIMARYPLLDAYVQGDPRGAALYVYLKADLAKVQSRDKTLGIDAVYSSIGVAAYK